MRPYEKRFLQTVLIVNGLCLGLFGLRILLTGSHRYLFIPENLLLAWLGFLFGWLLVRTLRERPWSSLQAVLLTLLWLVFLPNAWYVMTDFVHIDYTGEISQLYDIAMFNALIASGFLAGFTSLVLVHKQLLKRFSKHFSSLVVLAIILFASFAIYLGRDLRWNSADLFFNPGGLILNVSDRLVDPFGRPRMFNTTALFFVTISAFYWSIWRLAKDRN